MHLFVKAYALFSSEYVKEVLFAEVARKARGNLVKHILFKIN